MRAFVNTAIQPENVASSAKISAFVGTVLNVISQGGAIFANAPLSWFHVILNYVVPFCVATYSATHQEIARKGNQ